MVSLLFVVCFCIISYWWESLVRFCVIDFCIICFVDFFCKICLIRFSIWVCSRSLLSGLLVYFLSALNIQMYCIFLFRIIGIFASLTSVFWKYTLVKFYEVKMSMVKFKISPNAHALEHLHCVVCLISSIVVCIFGIDLSIVNFWLYSACLVFVIDTLFFVCNCQTLFPFFPIILPTDPAWLLPHDSWYYLFVDPLHFQ